MAQRINSRSRGSYFSFHEKFAERDMAKQAAAAARRKEKEDKDKGEQLRQNACQTLKTKRAGRMKMDHQE